MFLKPSSGFQIFQYRSFSRKPLPSFQGRDLALVTSASLKAPEVSDGTWGALQRRLPRKTPQMSDETEHTSHSETTWRDRLGPAFVSVGIALTVVWIVFLGWALYSATEAMIR